MNKKGFTLIELLVVISIMGFLSTVVLASVNSVREKAKETRVVSDMRAVITALEFFNDEHGFYPGQVPQAGVHFHWSYIYRNLSSAAHGSIVDLFEDTLVAEGYLPTIEEQMLQKQTLDYFYILYAVDGSTTIDFFRCDGQKAKEYIIFFSAYHAGWRAPENLPFYELSNELDPTPVPDYYCFMR